MHRYWSFWLIVVCVAVFFLQVTVDSFTDQMVLVSADVWSHPWTLVTSMFAHADFNHLFSNMFALFLFGVVLESIIDGKKFLAIYFLAGIVASLVTLPFYPATLGASGAIFGILGCLAVLRPHMVVYVSYVPMPMILAAFVWVLIDAFGVFMPTGTANWAHLAGIAVGLIAGLKLRSEFRELTEPRRAPPKIPEKEMRNWENRWLIGRRA